MNKIFFVCFYFLIWTSTFTEGNSLPGFEADCEEWITGCNNTGLVGRA